LLEYLRLRRGLKMAIIVCDECGKMLGKDNGPRGIRKEYCFPCGFRLLAEAGNLSFEEAAVYNRWLGGELTKDQAMGLMIKEDVK
jgi:hypothetical protein